MALGMKNNNKKNRRRGDERKAEFCTEKNKWKIGKNKKVGRVDIAKYEDKTMVFNGTIEVKYRDICDKPIMLRNVTVGTVVVDHIWVCISAMDQKKLKYVQQGTTIYCKGTVYVYKKLYKDIKDQYGIKNVQLVKSIQDR